MALIQRPNGAWGYSNYGGDSSSVASELSSGVSTIYIEHSFAATIFIAVIILFQDNLYESTIGTGIEIDATLQMATLLILLPVVL